MPAVIPRTVIITFNHLIMGVSPFANVMAWRHEQIEAGGDWPDLFVGDMQNAWQDIMLDAMDSNISYIGCSFVYVGLENGTTGERAPNPALPVVGTRSQTSMSPAVSYLAKKNILSARGIRAGRWYQPGVDEGSVDETGLITQAHAATILAVWQTWFAAVDNVERPVGTTWQFVVPHWPRLPDGNVDPDGVGSASVVTGVGIDRHVATQRRRQRRPSA